MLKNNGNVSKRGRKVNVKKNNGKVSYRFKKIRNVSKHLKNNGKVSLFFLNQLK